MPISPVTSGGPIQVRSENQPGASFRRELPGASKAELFALLREKVKKLGGEGEINISLDEASGTITGQRSKFPTFKVRFIASEGALEIKVDDYPSIKGDLLNAKLREILDLAPSRLDEARRRASGWQPPG